MSVPHGSRGTGLYRFSIGAFAAAVIGEGEAAPGGANVLFVDTGRERILIDAGAASGDGQRWLVAGLARAGIDLAGSTSSSSRTRTTRA